MTDYKTLKVWQAAVKISVRVYSATDTFPNKEVYGITDQIRRAAVSIPSNIAEGSRRASDRDFKHFLHVALGSCAELQTQLIIAKELKYLPEQDFKTIFDDIESVNAMLLAFIKKLGSV